MSFDLPADPATRPAPVETSTLLIYLRGGQTIRLEVTDWDMTRDPTRQNVTWLDTTCGRPGERMPHIRLDAIDAVVVMPAAQT